MPTERFLALEPQQQAAIVAIYLDPFAEETADVCTGALISAEHVLTARHCVAGVADAAQVEVRFGADGDDPDRTAQVADIELHPDLDLAVLLLSNALSEADGVAALALPTQAFDASLIGRATAVAGYGLDDRLIPGARAFAIATLDALDDPFLSVAGLAGTGLCFGDSGGPLLSRAADGEVEVLGVLTQGSSACDGEDRFTRIDRGAAWIEALVAGAEAPASPDCSALGEAGRCYGERAMRCVAGEVVVEVCGSSEVCGWDATQGVHACVAPSADACNGTAELGRCTGALAESCEAGVLTAIECGCGMRCAVSGRDGRAECVISE